MPVIENMIGEWMEWLFIVRGRKVRGVEQYAKIVRSFFAWMGQQKPDVQLEYVDMGDVEDWMRALFYDMGNVSNRSRASKLSALRSFFGWLQYSNRRADNPAKQIPTPRIQQSLPQKFSTEELRLIFAAPDKSKLMGLRDLAILMTLYASGPRVSELCNLDMNHIHDSGGVIRLHFVDTKGGKDRTITIAERPAKVLREWMAARAAIKAETKAVFLSLAGQRYSRLSAKRAQDILDKYARKSGVGDADVFIHKLRSTYASDLYDSGHDQCPRCGHKINHVDLLMVQLALGHSDPKTTMPYIAISERHLKKTRIPNSRFKEIEEG